MLNELRDISFFAKPFLEGGRNDNASLVKPCKTDGGETLTDVLQT